ncbi:MAG: hypothetical protein IKN49_00060 [Elusimicrobiaceae bacterium]|nr:hypothetical protein [Elusimicrobiaceae bacterium]
MKKWLILGCICYAVASWAAPAVCDVKQEVPLRFMEQELKRSFAVLKKQKPPIYYLSYTYQEGENEGISVELGGVIQQYHTYTSNAEVQARAGSLQLDDTHALKGEGQDTSLAGVESAAQISIENPKSFKLAWWRATQKAVEQAQANYSRVTANVRTMSETKDQSDDFVFPPKQTACYQQDLQTVDIEKIKDLLVEASKLVIGKEYVLDSSFSFGITQGHRYFVDSRGTRLKTPYARLRLMYRISNRTADGMTVERFKDYNVFSQEELPSVEQLTADVQQSLQELADLTSAPEGEPLNAPTILKGKAAAVFVHEVLGHRLEGHRQKDDSEGQTFTGKVGQPVVSSLLTIVDDPTLTQFNGTALRGHYLYDDEGVQARPVTLIENGVLKNFLMSSSPINGFALSNGHGRRETGRRAVARMGIMRTTASQTVPYEQLEQQLLEEIKRQGKPYGFIVEDLGGGFTFTGTSMPQSFKLQAKLLWRVYPDGRRELVRGLDVVGTPLVSFNKVLAVGDDDTVFDGSCGAESGWVPQTNIAPSLLLQSMEMEKTQKGDFKPPVLPSPLLKKEGK